MLKPASERPHPCRSVPGCKVSRHPASPPLRNPPVRLAAKTASRLMAAAKNLAQTIEFPLVAPSSSRHIQAGGEDDVALDSGGGGGHLRPQRGVAHDTSGVAEFAACLIQPHHRAHYRPL